MPHHPPAKTLFIQTYGCQMNVYDSGRMADVLAKAGYGMVASAAEADVVILNTCHIREKAAEKVYSEIGRLRSIMARPASDGGRRILAIAGCVAQAEGEELLARAPAVDLVVGPQSYHRLADMVDRARGGESGVIDTEFPAASKFDDLPESRATTSPGVAYLTVQEGCDRFCTFCVVPYTRGAEYSRPATDVLAEAAHVVALGAREIILLGQNVNAYHGVAPDGTIWRLAQLIAALAVLPGVERVRYTTSHPADMTDDLITAHRDIPALMPFLHLPVQSGSDRILAAMNRRHVADDYRRIVERLRRSRPDLALSSDFIVGFPGETDDDFRDTLALVEDIGFSQAYSFKYSPRPGTPAAEAPQLDEAVKSERLLVLQELLDRQKQAFNQACVGQTQPVLFDRKGRNTGQLVGRGPYMQAVHANAPDSTLGHICEVAIDHAGPNSLSGRLLIGAPV